MTTFDDDWDYYPGYFTGTNQPEPSEKEKLEDLKARFRHEVKIIIIVDVIVTLLLGFFIALYKVPFALIVIPSIVVGIKFFFIWRDYRADKTLIKSGSGYKK